MRRILAPLAVSLVLAACGGGSDGGGSGPKVTPVATVAVTPPTASVVVGASVALSASTADASGNALTGRTITWTSSAPSIAVVTSNGIVTGISAGTATITATSEGKSATTQLVVTPAVQAIAITNPSPSLTVGQTAQLTATATATGGAVVSNVTFTWASSNEAVVSVTQSGLVTAKAPGSVQVTASSGGVSGATTITVGFAGGGSLTLTDVSPGTLNPGAVATITGTGFSTDASQNLVTLGGVAATVTTATATQLTITVPTGLPCQSTGNVALNVSSPFGAATRPQPVKTANARTLAVGEVAYLALDGQLDCNELVNAGRYVVSVVNAAPASSSTQGFQLRALGPSTSAILAGAASASLVATPTLPVSPGPTVVAARRLSSARSSEQDWRAARERAESKVRAVDRQILRTLGSPRRYRDLARASQRATNGSMSATAAAGVKLTVGAKDTLKVVDINRGNCTSFSRVGARVVYVGPRAVVLEADDAPLAGQMDADYVELAQEFEQTMFPILLNNFGNPLAYDASLDNNQRIVMFFTKKVNDVSSALLGYVFSCDFFPPSVSGASGSNQAEIFYARVPTLNTGGYSSTNEKNVWKWRMRATLIHEVKHVTSYAELFETPIEGEYEDSWLEEGTAQIAEELYGRAFFQTQWKGNANYAQTMHCDLTPNPATFPECASRAGQPWPHAIGDHYLFLYDYATGHELNSFISSGAEASHIYGSAWAFIRWAIDQYATTESSFLKALVTSYTVRGVQNMEQRTGRDFGELAALFSLAMATDDALPFTPPAGAKYTFPSWNLPTMWSGLVGDFGRAPYTNPAPFTVRTGAFGAFNSGTLTIAGSSAAVFDFSGGAAGSLLELRASTDQPLPRGNTLRVAVLRVQ